MRKLVCIGLAGAFIAGCGAQGPGRAARNEPVNTGLRSITSDSPPSAGLLPTPDPRATGDGLEALTAQAALDLERVLASGALDTPSPKTDVAPPPAGSSGAIDAPALTLREHMTDPDPGSAPGATTEEAPTAEAVDSPTTLKTDPEPAPPDPLVSLARQMAALLLQKDDQGRARIADTVALAPIEAMRPGALAGLDADGSELARSLSHEERETLIAARDRVIANPGNGSEALAAALSGSAHARGVRISRSALCSRVLGFGRYEPLSTSTFVAGRPIRAIVYVEVEGFGSRPARRGDPAPAGADLGEHVSVELSQSLTLYHDESGLQAWHRPARTAIETSRNIRRDFYLIQQIELPTTLSIGRYNLKVVVKDATTGHETEVVMPLAIVADSSALTKR